MSPLSATAPPAGCVPPSPARKPRGNPTLQLAPRCGARTRAGCPCQAPAIRGKLRCRLHGGRSTGPRTPEGRANIRTARTIHGGYGATARAKNRRRITLLSRNRVVVAADRYLDFLPPEFVARLHYYPPELLPPSTPTGGITAAQDQMRRRAVAAALAPWRRAIAAAREAARAARKQAAAARATNPKARVRPRRPRPRRPTPQALFAALLAELLAPERAPTGPDAGLTEPRVPFPSAGPAALAPMPAPDPHATAQAVPARCAHENARPEPCVPERVPTPPDIGAPKPYVPFPPAGPAAPSPMPARSARPTAPTAPAQRAHTNGQPEPFVPGGAPGAHQTSAPKPLVPVPAEAAPAIPPGLPNRAARRRWMHQQRRLHRAPPVATRP